MLLKEVPIQSRTLVPSENVHVTLETNVASLVKNPTLLESEDSELLVTGNPGVGAAIIGQCDVVSEVLEMESRGGQVQSHLASAGGLAYSSDGEMGGRGLDVRMEKAYDSDQEPPEYKTKRIEQLTHCVRHSQKRLKSLVKKHRVSVVAILEPFHEESKMPRLASFLEFSKFCCNEYSGGKAWLFWKEEYGFEVLNMTNQSLSGWFHLGTNQVFVTFVYAKCTMLECRGLSGELDSISIVDDPWLVVGDFNVICSDSERIGGNPRPVSTMVEFNESLDNCGLVEMRVHGRSMSWCNDHNGRSRSWARLDLPVMNVAFSNLFGSVYMEYLMREPSNHCPMVVHVCPPRLQYGPSPFRFQNMWCSHESFFKCVEEAWAEPAVGGSGLYKLAAKLKKVKVTLKQWNQNTFGRVDLLIKTLEEKVEFLELQLQDKNNPIVEEEFLLAKQELAEWDAREEMRLAQKAKRKCPNVHPADLSALVDPVISAEENTLLCASPAENEVKAAVFSIPKHSFPGPDGFGSSFYMFCWEIVKEDVIEAARDFFSGASLLRFYSSSYIVLIPKVPDPKSFDTFRPISLCFVAYKKFLKILVNRLTSLLPKIILQEQRVFISGRSIFENITLVQEMVQSLHKKTQGGNMLLNVNMTKENDRVHWDFLL
ncbi:uncharacterized protein LOC122291014 [Carya illinoinensis]|uniref:uncharacterized protein LOC122291014 n=1 Tax=Carya illinoinensis TaxID=32201 RepID=UPI001C724BF6|nr:uncharacterized protein LOC122291014 [Carya illinoinensis]